MIYKTLDRKLHIEQNEHNKRLNSGSYSSSDTRRDTVRRHERRVIWKSCWTPVCINTYQ